MADHRTVAATATQAPPLDQLLERALDDASLRRNTESVARLPAHRGDEGETIILFERLDELLALPAASVARAFPPLPVHRVPHRPGPTFLGVASERGELRLVASLESVLELLPSTRTIDSSRRRMLMLQVEGEAWLFEVDAVLGVRRSNRAEWTTPPATVAHRRGRLTSHLVPVDSRRAALLDPARVASVFRESIG